MNVSLTRKELIHYLVISQRLTNIEKEIRMASQELVDLKTLFTKTMTDINAKLASITITGLSADDKAIIAEISASLTALDQQLSGVAPS